MRTELARLRHMSNVERAYLARATVLMPAVAASLRWRGFRRTYRWLEQSSYTRAPVEGPEFAHEIGGIVRLVARRHPGYKASCLPQSLVLWHFLRGSNLPAELRIGVDKRSGSFRAHAWVELNGEVLNDAADVTGRYATIDVAHRLLSSRT